MCVYNLKCNDTKQIDRRVDIVIEIVGKKSRLKLITSGVILIVVLSFVSFVSSAQGVSTIPIHRDVLIVRLGNEEAPRITSDIIGNFLNELKDERMDSENNNIDQGWKSKYFVGESIQCTQPIQNELQKSKLITDIIQSNILSFSNDIARFRASIIIIIGHGSESGIADESGSDLQMTWSNVVASTTKVQPQLTILACCFSSNAVSNSPNIVGFNGVVDALLVGYVVSLLLTQLIPDTPSFLFEDTFYSALYRSDVLIRDETSLLPLSIQSDWAAIRIPVVAVLSGLFFICAYQTIWAVQAGLSSVAAAILIGATGVVIGGLFQVALELIRNTVGIFLQAINYTMGKIFNATIGAILGFSISYLSSLLLPSVISAALYAVTGTTAALVLANTPVPWVRAAACLSAAIGLISIIDIFVQLM